jgi:hypothetical protein
MRQAAQRSLTLHGGLPIARGCAVYPDFPEAREISAACDAWLRKRGLIEPDNFCYGAKTKQQTQEKNTTDETTVF